VKKPQPGTRKVELEFSAAQTLPGGDARAVTALLSFVGFAPPPLPPSRLEQFPQDLRRPLVQAAGVSDDGWVGPAASFHLTEPEDAWYLSVTGMVPQIGDASGFTTEAVVLLDGQEVGRRNLGLGQFEIRIPVTPQSAERARRVELKFTAAQTLPAPDGRNVAARLTAARFITGNE
jgi:hypothetical protein